LAILPKEARPQLCPGEWPFFPFAVPVSPPITFQAPPDLALEVATLPAQLVPISPTHAVVMAMRPATAESLRAAFAPVSLGRLSRGLITTQPEDDYRDAEKRAALIDELKTDIHKKWEHWELNAGLSKLERLIRRARSRREDAAGQ